MRVGHDRPDRAQARGLRAPVRAERMTDRPWFAPLAHVVFFGLVVGLLASVLIQSARSLRWAMVLLVLMLAYMGFMGWVASGEEDWRDDDGL